MTPFRRALACALLCCATLLAGSGTLGAQEGSASRPIEVLERTENHFALALGIYGGGIDISISHFLRIGGRTALALGNAQASWYILRQNATPYVGLGVGYEAIGFTGESQAAQIGWTSIHAGYELAFGRWFLQGSLQVPVAYKCEGRDCREPMYSRFVGDLSLGLRVF